jgi:NAD(P)-dependent dehydrogenase (short-subunit alcohol dehydrogenase family)
VKLDGMTALVTGGASGIGAAVVRRLTEAGCRTAVADVKPADTELVIHCDVAVEADVVGALSQVRETWGRLDIAVLAAGIGGMAPITEMTSAEWDRVVGVNLRGTFLCLRESASLIAEGGRGGAIVAVSSVSGFLADRLTGHYNVSKAGVDMLVRVAARELGPKGIRVNAVAPGTTDTPLFAATARLPGYQEKVAARAALGRIGTADDVAAAVVALVELDWVTGQVLVADGGLSLWSPIDIVESMDTT